MNENKQKNLKIDHPNQAGTHQKERSCVWGGWEVCCLGTSEEGPQKDIPLHIPMSKSSTRFFFFTFCQWEFSSSKHSKEKLALQLWESVTSHISVRFPLIMLVFSCNRALNAGRAWGSWSKCIQFLIFLIQIKFFLVQEINKWIYYFKLWNQWPEALRTRSWQKRLL